MDITQKIFNAGFSTCATAGAATLLGSPIGIAGGAICGITLYATRFCSDQIVNDPLNNYRNHLAIRVATYAISVIAIVACSWQLAALLGVSMGLKSFVSLCIVSSGINSLAYRAAIQIFYALKDAISPD